MSTNLPDTTRIFGKGIEGMSRTTNNQTALPFTTPAEPAWLRSKTQSAQGNADDVLRTLDHLSTTLDELRKEVDAMESDWPPPAA